MNLQKDTGITREAPLEEQSICITCGLCCDCTLFLNAWLNPGERGHLPEKIEQASFRDGDKEYFRLPCKYFSEQCTIYDRKRPYVCGSYRCQLLRDFAGGKISMDDALELVREAKGMRREIIEEYCRIYGKSEAINFREIMTELGKIRKPDPGEGAMSADHEHLLARCNIFEALLIKHFRSAEDFEKLIMR